MQRASRDVHAGCTFGWRFNDRDAASNAFATRRP
jgi:hypothetical protein